MISTIREFIEDSNIMIHKNLELYSGSSEGTSDTFDLGRDILDRNHWFSQVKNMGKFLSLDCVKICI